VRILLDECIDVRLRDELLSHEVHVVSELGWSGRQNGDLLQAAAARFDAFVTLDRNIQHQQNLSRYDIAVVVLAAASSRLADLRALVPLLLRVLPDAQKRRATIVS
jgi:predicted nuclease of predicted toxin-antitoxin system